MPRWRVGGKSFRKKNISYDAPRMEVVLPEEKELAKMAAENMLRAIRERLESGLDAAGKRPTLSPITARIKGSTRPFIDTGHMVKDLQARPEGDGYSISVPSDREEAARQFAKRGNPVLGIEEKILNEALKRVLKRAIK